MKIKSGKIKLKELLFFSAWTIYILYTYFSASVIAYKIPHIFFSALMLVVMALLFIKWVYTERISLKKTIILVLVFTLSSFAALTGEYESLILTMFMIFSSGDIENSKIIRHLAVWTFFCAILIIAMSLIGIIPNYTYPHNSGNKIVIANSFGFKHYITLGCIVMTLSAIYLYFKEKIRIIDCLIVLIINYLAFKFHTGRLTFIITSAMVVTMYMAEKIKVNVFRFRPISIFLTISPYIFMFFTLLSVYTYFTGKLRIINQFWGTTESRLISSIQAIQTYGIHLWGTHIEQYGITATYYQNGASSFFVDSGYVFVLIAYGAVFSIMYLGLLSILFRFIISTQSRKLVIWFGYILLACVVNNFLTDLVNNPILFYIPSALIGKKLNKRKYNEI